jgi:MATE family multidrug resistance protein
MTPFAISTAAGAGARLRREIVATFALCWPIVLTNLAMNLMTTTDVMMLGWLSPEALAAGSLGFNLYLPLMLFSIGIVGAAAPIAASRIGADSADAEGVRRVGHQALISSLLLALPVWAILWNAAPILRAIGEPPQLATDAGLYVHGLQWAVAPLLLTFSTRSILAALNRTGPVLVASLIAVVFNALANYVLIFGHFGAPALGIFGSGLATSLSHLLMFLLLVGYSFLDPRVRTVGLFSQPWRPHAASLAQIWRLGLPIGAAIAAEISVFSFSALLMGLLGPDSIEAHAIVIQIAATAFMVPLGLGQAASVRVGHAFGARDRAAVSLAGWTAFGMTMAFVAISAGAMFAFPRLLISPFIATEAAANAAVVALALSFLRIAAIFQLFDGGQAALANMLRGVHDSRWPMIMALAGYWGIGMPTGLVLAFLTPLRGLGLWIGLAIGLAVVALLLLGRWWNKERRGFF